MNKFDWKLFIAISLPVLLIVVLAAFYVIPNSLAQPHYDFIYFDTSDYANQHYTIQLVNKKVVATLDKYYINTNTTTRTDTDQIKIKRYHVASKVVDTLTIEEANKLTLSGSAESPDGFTIGGSNSYGGLVSEVLVGGQYDSYDQLYLHKGLTKKKVNLGTSRYGFNFIAWVIQ